jgi:molybdate transport system permease protein
VGSDRPFLIGLAILGGLYVLLIVAMIAADFFYVLRSNIQAIDAVRSPEIRYAIVLSLASTTASALFSLVVAIPLGYLLSRYSFWGKRLVDAIIDVPVVLPPLVVGISLLILCRLAPEIPYTVESVVIAQFSVAAAFAVRTMRVAFDQISPRSEQVAQTLGCSRAQAFFRVVIPEARRGILASFTIAWARSLGEFGPVLVFSGATRMKTEVLSTTVFLELSIGHLDMAVAVSLLMVAAAIAVLVTIRLLGSERTLERAIGG